MALSTWLLEVVLALGQLLGVHTQSMACHFYRRYLFWRGSGTPYRKCGWQHSVTQWKPRKEVVISQSPWGKLPSSKRPGLANFSSTWPAKLCFFSNNSLFLLITGMHMIRKARTVAHECNLTTWRWWRKSRVWSQPGLYKFLPQKIKIEMMRQEGEEYVHKDHF